MFGCQHGRAPRYLIDYCLPVSDVESWQHLRSASQRLMCVTVSARTAAGLLPSLALPSFLQNAWPSEDRSADLV